jgi:hypothetical protein
MPCPRSGLHTRALDLDRMEKDFSVAATRWRAAGPLDPHALVPVPAEILSLGPTYRWA